MRSVSFVSASAVRVTPMPSYLHEVLVEMFRDRPALAAELLTGPLGLSVPLFGRARVFSADLTNVAPTEYRADAVVTLSVGDAPVLGVVVEVQLSDDGRKRRSWPAYVATLYARLGCPVELLVVCPDPVDAAWCGTPIAVNGSGFVLTPQVLGPAQVPVVTDPELAKRQPELAVLSAMAHGERFGGKGVFEALLAALEAVDQDHADLYTDIVLAALPEAIRDYLEALMSASAIRARYGYQSDFARRYYGEGKAEGKAEGEARAVLAVLDARGIEVPDPVREDITGCTDLDQLDTWIRRAVTANKVQDLFD
jgi:hypothetical protein